MSVSREELGRAVVEISGSLKELRADLLTARRLAAAAAAQMAHAIHSGVSGAFRGAGSLIAGFVRSVTGALGRIGSIAKTSFLALEGAAAVALTSGVKSAMEFEKSLSRIVGLTNTSADQVKVWRGEVLKMAAATGRAPNELAEALFFIASAGIDASVAMDVLLASAQAAAAGLGTTVVVADAVTSAINAYGKENLSAAKAVDILTQAVNVGKIEAEALAPVIGRVIPIAAELGVSFDQVAAALAAMSLSGLDADESATALRNLLSKLLRPSKQAADTLAEFGLSAEGLRKQLREKGLLSVLDTLRTSFGDNDEAIAMVFEDVRGLVGVLSLVGENASRTTQIFDQLANSTGALDKAFGAFEDSEFSRFEKAKARLQAGLISVGSEVLPMIADAFEALIPTIVALARHGAIVVSVLAPILAQLLPHFTTLIQALGKALAIAAPALGPLVSGFAGLLTLVAKALVLLAPLLAPLIDLFVRLASEALAALAPMLPPLIDAVVRFVAALSEALRPVWEALITEVLPTLIDAFTKLLNAITESGLIDALSKLISELSVALVDALSDVIHELIAKGFIAALTDLVIALAALAPDVIKALADVMIAITPVLVSIVQAFTDLIDLLGGKRTPGQQAEAVGNIVPNTPEDLRKRLGRQHGGPITPNRPYWVGEAGPELFSSGSVGEIIPLPASGGGPTSTVVVNVAGSVVTEREITNIVRDILLERQRRGSRIVKE